MIIKNEKLCKLLKEKEKIVKEGRKLNKELEEKSNLFVKNYLIKKGIEYAGIKIIPETKDKEEEVVLLYKGSFNDLKNAFSLESLQDINDLVSEKFEDLIQDIKSKELQIVKINDKVNELITIEIMPTLNLDEFETIRQVRLEKNDDIYLEIVNVVDEFKKKYLVSKEEFKKQLAQKDA